MTEARADIVTRIGLRWFGEMRLPEMREQIEELLDVVEADSQVLAEAERRGAVKALRSLGCYEALRRAAAIDSGGDW